MGRRSTMWQAALFTHLAVFIASPAIGKSEICIRLEARLMALDSRAAFADPDKDRAYEKSVQKQRNELDQTTADARRAGCMGAFFRRLKTKPACGPMMASIDRMRAKLNRLTAARDSPSRDPFAGGRERAELIQSLRASDCGAHYENADRPRRKKGLFTTLFGGHRFRERGWGDTFHDSDFGAYRTLCVRTCDGYYFPISFSAVRSRFVADEQTCRSMCPGTEVALYVHRNPGQEADAMISLAGEPYTALPTAFRYRKAYDPECKCGQIEAPPPPAFALTDQFSAQYSDPWKFARGTNPLALPEDQPPIPLWRPEAGEDPETLANRGGRFKLEPVETEEETVTGIPTHNENSVRIVGPAYFFAQ